MTFKFRVSQLEFVFETSIPTLLKKEWKLELNPPDESYCFIRSSADLGVELEPGKVLHDRRERLFGPLVVIVLHPRFKALLIEGMETATFRMREAWTNAMVSKRHLFALSNPITAYSAYNFFAESPCMWLSSTFSAIFLHPTVPKAKSQCQLLF
ncbi:hypothetical protein Lal_00032985 [Lupinus albus]|nr:hypothetical protein Lal_00032985 [Lupinus albus]